MKPLSADTLLARTLARLATIVIRHPRWFVYSQVALFLASIAVTVAFLKFDMNQDDLVGPNLKYHRNFLALQKDFPNQGNDLVVVAESADVEKNRQFIERLAMKMAPDTNLFQDIFYQQSLAMLGTKALFYVPTNDLASIRTMLHDNLPFIRQFTQTTNLVSFFEQVNTAFRTTPHEANEQTDSLIQALPVLTRILTQANADLLMPGEPPSPGVASLFVAGDVSDTYLTLNHGRMFLLTTHAPNDALVGPAIDRLRELIRQTKTEVPGVNAGLTGQPVLDYDQMTQSEKDIILASIVSLILCALIFIYGYNETGRPVKATLCLLVGMGYTMGFTTLTVGHLNVLTITFVPMLIGLAIDYGVHLITRYEEELRHGRPQEEALAKAMVFTGQGIFTGSLTTAGAFLAMYFTRFKGIQEMGIICGGGLLLCLIPMMTLLPVLLLRGRQNIIDRQHTEDQTRARIENIWLRRPVLVVGITLVISALAGTQIYEGKPEFDYNLMKLQSRGLSSVVFAQKLTHADKSTLAGAIVATNLDQAIALEKRLVELTNTVADVEPPLDMLENFIEKNQMSKLGLIEGIKEEVAPLKFSPPDTQPVNIDNFSSTLFYLRGYCGLALDEIGTNNPALSRQLVSLQQAIDHLRKTMLAGGSAAVAAHADKLAVFQQGLFSDIRETFQSLQHQSVSSPLSMDDLPPALKNQFVGKNGKILLQVFPKHDVWQRDNQAAFVADMRTVDPDATGTPVQFYEYETLMKNSYIQAAWYSLMAIAILVLIHFRSLIAMILALLPVGIGTLWLAGAMGWFGIPFNLANIMTLPLVIGIGVTNGVQILNRFAEEGTPSILARSTGKAVLVSGLTAIAGFGSLILAKHQGIQSLGYVMSVGITACMIAGLTFLPAVLNLLGRFRPLIKQPSADNTSPTPGQEEPR
ncbi:MAG TPA: MMPL family transporter [Verrucomicrobiae bacterium]|nr:MMPL family transporter [Verrucomicrobiae bacterium]